MKIVIEPPTAGTAPDGTPAEKEVIDLEGVPDAQAQAIYLFLQTLFGMIGPGKSFNPWALLGAAFALVTSFHK